MMNQNDETINTDSVEPPYFAMFSDDRQSWCIKPVPGQVVADVYSDGPKLANLLAAAPELLAALKIAYQSLIEWHEPSSTCMPDCLHCDAIKAAKSAITKAIEGVSQ